MSNTSPFTKVLEPWMLAVKCASAITNTRLAYRLSATDHETAVLCGDNEPIAGFPDRTLTSTQASYGETVNLRMAGHLEGIASEAMAINQPFTSAAGGKLRVAVFGTDHIQGWVESAAAADGDRVTVRKGA